MTDPFLAGVMGLDPGAEIELYIIDLTDVGYPIRMGFTPSEQVGNSIWFAGREFLARDIKMDGFSKSSDDAPPQPQLRMGNLDKGGNAMLQQYADLLGAKVTRFTTFERFLQKLPDGSPNPQHDPAAIQLPEIWYIEQKVGNTPELITWKMSSVLDIRDKQIPARIVLKNVCRRAYRSWNEERNDWDYAAKNACPYTGDACFTRDNSLTFDRNKDACPKDLYGCGARYGDEDLPGWFFPGVTRISG